MDLTPRVPNLLAEANAWLRFHQQPEVDVITPSAFPGGRLRFQDHEEIVRLLLEDAHGRVVYQLGADVEFFRMGADHPAFGDESPPWSRHGDLLWFHPPMRTSPWTLTYRRDGFTYRPYSIVDDCMSTALRTRSLAEIRASSPEDRVSWLIEAGAVPVVRETLTWQW